MNTILAFGPGCRGNLIEALQQGLQLFVGRRIEGGADGNYATHTLQAVQESARKLIARGDKDLNRRLADGGALDGFAPEALWMAIGVEWPEDFPRCLQLVMAFEGTGFGGAEGPKQTGDRAGVTWGAIGFTSYNGEVQELLHALYNIAPPKFQELLFQCMPDNKERATFYNLIADGAPYNAFADWGLEADGDVRSSLKLFLREMGKLDWVRHEQMAWAYKRYWIKACDQAAALFANGADSRVGIRAKLLLFDVAVQNGGLRAEELRELQLMYKVQPLTPSDKLWAICNCVTQRVKAKGGPDADVHARKSTICAGIGKVHGEEFKLDRWAL